MVQDEERGEARGAGHGRTGPLLGADPAAPPALPGGEAAEGPQDWPRVAVRSESGYAVVELVHADGRRERVIVIATGWCIGPILAAALLGFIAGGLFAAWALR